MPEGHERGAGVQLGVYSFGDTPKDPSTGRMIGAQERIQQLLAEIELADQVGLDVFGIGEHHRADFSVSAR
jgi:alkanesulfonate monooxygenase SsuD/methylene tetrahydromethanopterin reductase-like flavin-dependent oxidoreductase (luciferase family)